MGCSMPSAKQKQNAGNSPRPRPPVSSVRSHPGPILSVCIITRNRAPALERLLTDLQTEMVPGVEVCVSDNASTDSTAQVIARWRGRLPLRYQKNRRNLGGEQNVLAACSMARGQYVWFMGDDDLLAPGALSSLARALYAHADSPIGAVYLNAAFESGKLASHFAFQGFQVFPSSDLSAVREMGNLTFLGSVCLSRQAAQSIIRSGTRVRNGRIYKTALRAFALDEFPHVYLFLQCLRACPQYAVMALPMQIISGRGSAFSYGRYLRVQSVHLRYAVQLRQYYPQFKVPIRFTLKYVTVAFLVLANAAHADSRLEPLSQAYLTLLSRALCREGAFWLPPFLCLYRALHHLPLFPLLFEKVGQVFLNSSAPYSRKAAAAQIWAVMGKRMGGTKIKPPADGPAGSDPAMALLVRLFPPIT